MIIVVFGIAFIISYIAIYIVSIFSWENSDPITILKANWIIWGLSIIIKLLNLTWIIWIWISTIVSMITFMKLLWFEPNSSFFAWLFYSIIYYFLLIITFSLIMW